MADKEALHFDKERIQKATQKLSGYGILFEDAETLDSTSSYYRMVDYTGKPLKFANIDVTVTTEKESRKIHKTWLPVLKKHQSKKTRDSENTSQ